MEMQKTQLAKNTTDRTRWTVVQIGPTYSVIGHYATRERAEVARGRYLAKPHGSGVGPIVQIFQLAPGEYLTR